MQNTEKRTAPRYLDGQFTYLFPLRGAAQVIEIVDTAAQGLGLSATQPVWAGRHWLQILYRNGARRRFMVEVLYCRPRGDGRYHVGARPLTLDQGDRLHWHAYQGFVRSKALPVAV